MIPFADLPLTVPRGRDAEIVLQPATSTVIYRPVTAIAISAPVRLTVPAHGVPPGWTVQAVGKAGVSPLLLCGPQLATVIDADTIDINARQSLDWPAYSGGVQLAYNQPLSLTGYTARLRAYNDSADASFLFELIAGDGITISAGTLTAHFSAARTALWTKDRGFYSLSLSDATGNYLLASGIVTLRAVGGP